MVAFLLAAGSLCADLGGEAQCKARAKRSKLKDVKRGVVVTWMETYGMVRDLRRVEGSA